MRSSHLAGGEGEREKVVENGDQELPEALESIGVTGGVVVAGEQGRLEAGEG